eukprot:6260817-Pyramimonas_sp.AAC.1
MVPDVFLLVQRIEHGLPSRRCGVRGVRNTWQHGCGNALHALCRHYVEYLQLPVVSQEESASGCRPPRLTGLDWYGDLSCFKRSTTDRPRSASLSR